MLNHTQELVGNCHVSSSTPTYHAQSRHGSGGDREFSFWCASSNAESSRNDCFKLPRRSESAFELSFQYMVQQQQQQALQPNQILRVESMENENFLLKMFFPSSLDWKKKAKVGSIPKLSPTPSFHNSIKQKGKEQRMKSFQAGDNRSDLKDHTDESTNDSHKRRSKSRYVDDNFSRGCWPFQFFSKAKKQGGSR